MLSLLVKNCDIISPNITLYFHRSKRQTNPVGGTLTIIVMLLILASSSYFLYEFFGKTSPKAFVLNKYLDDVGIVSTNQKQMFNTLHINKLPELVPMPFDKKALSPITIVQFNNGSLIAKYYYDYCIYDKDLLELEEFYPLNNKEIIESTHLCKRYLIDNKGKKITSDDEEFYFPMMGHGMSSQTQRSIDFITLVERCTNSTENNNSCYPEEMIDAYYTNILFTFKFIDNYIDISNYNTPERRFLNRIEGMLHPSSVGNNYLTFKAITIFTHNGVLFDNKERYDSYKYDYRVESIQPRGTDKKVFQINCSLQNMSDIYDRSYVRLQDVAANIGGIIDFLILLGVILNFFPEQYQKILDCEKTLEHKTKSEFKLNRESSLKDNNMIRSENSNLKIFSNNPGNNSSQDHIYDISNINPNKVIKFQNKNDIILGKNENAVIISNLAINKDKEDKNKISSSKRDNNLAENYFSYTLRKIVPCFKRANEEAIQTSQYYYDLYYYILDFENLVQTMLEVRRLSKLFKKELKDVEPDFLNNLFLSSSNSRVKILE